MLSLSLSYTHISIHMYVYILCIYMYFYILLAAINESPIAASRNRGGDESSDDNSKCENIRRTISTCDIAYGASIPKAAAVM